MYIQNPELKNSQIRGNTVKQHSSYFKAAILHHKKKKKELDNIPN